MPLAVLFSLAFGFTDSARLFFFINLVTFLSTLGFLVAVAVFLVRRRVEQRVQVSRVIAMGTTTARILHQIKNPVQGLLLQAELLKEFERSGLEEERREAGEAILGEALRLTVLLSELSAWTSGERRELQRQPLRLDRLLREIAEQSRPEAERLEIRMETRIGAGIHIAADPYYLRQAIENLLRNAREALAEREGDRRMVVELDRNLSGANVRISDNGPGIRPDLVDTIFEPFVTTKGTGMGLGMAITKEIVEKHGGRIRVSSHPGVGTTVTVVLPVRWEDLRSTTLQPEAHPDRAERDLRTGHHAV
jgi:signal transduction histidine kinase